MTRTNISGENFWKPAIRLGFPVALQNLLMSSFALVDTLMVGQLGDTAVAAVGMAGQWSWLMHIFFYGTASGAAVFISQYWGAKDFSGIRKAYGCLAVGCTAVALMMMSVAIFFPQIVLGLFTKDPVAIETGVSYLRIAGFSYLAMAISQVFSTVLRSTEEVKLPMYGSVIGFFCNTVLNYGFIFGRLGLPEMGVAGAALATVISAWISPVFVFVVSRKRRNLLICPPRALFTFDWAFVKHYFVVSLPVVVNEGVWAVGTVGYNMIFGHMGTAQYAALTIFRTVESIFFAFYIGLCHACAVLVGREIGAGRTEDSIQYANRFTVVMVGLSVVLGLSMIALRGVFLLPFQVSPEVRGLTYAILLIYALEIPIRNLPFVCICGIFRPGGDTRTGLYLDILSVWMIALPLTVVLGLVLKLDFLLVYVIMLVSEDWLKAFLCVRRLRSRKWVMPVVRAKK